MKGMINLFKNLFEFLKNLMIGMVVLFDQKRKPLLKFTIPSMDRKIAIVTGGNGGIGAEVVKELAKNGCTVVLGD